MPYEIKNKSRDVCVISYVKAKKFDRGFWIDYLSFAVRLAFMVIILSIMAIGLTSSPSGLPFIPLLVIIAVAMSWNILSKAITPTVFEIELNRIENLVSVRSTEHPHKKPVTYPLDSFRGLVSAETTFRHNSKMRLRAELHFKLEPITGMVRNVPVQKRKYFVSPKNADKIIAVTDKWLQQAKVKSSSKAALMPVEAGPDKQVVRDFRDME